MSGRPICNNKTNLIKIILEVSEILRLFRFSRSPSWILEILTFNGWRVLEGQMYSCAIFGQNPSIHCGVIAIFWLYKITAAAILDFRFSETFISWGGMEVRSASWQTSSKSVNLLQRYFFGFYRAMHYSAKRSLAITCRLFVHLSVTLVDHDDIGGKSLKLIARTISSTSLFFVAKRSSTYS